MPSWYLPLKTKSVGVGDCKKPNLPFLQSLIAYRQIKTRICRLRKTPVSLKTTTKNKVSYRHPSSQFPISCRNVGRGTIPPQRGGLVRYGGDDGRVLDSESVHWLVQLLVADDVGGLRVQLAHVLLLEAQREALHLRQLAAGLQYHQDAHQAQQQVDCGGRGVGG